MNMTVWDPIREMEALLDRYSRSPRKNMTGEGSTFESGDWMPTVDISETDHDFLIRAELPGVDKENVHVTLDNGILTIKGEKKTETKDEKQHRIECSYGSFVRSFTLPQNVATEKVEAGYKDGILNLTIPKLEIAKPKQIEVQVN
jgi:HSP20 family protein